MKAWRRIGCLVVLAGCLFSSACSSEDDVSMQGAGATFPAPLYKRWFLEYYKRNPEVQVNYLAIGSGAGIRQFKEGLTDFGASDAFEKELKGDKRKGEGPFMLPMTAGSIAICYNLPDGPAALRLSREVYVDIFLGKITEWNDSRIAKDNSEVTLPDTAITVVRRADSSGTTFAFTNHLNTIGKNWRKDKRGPGKGKSVNWPTGLGGKGNAGVAAIVKQTPGAIGYLEFGFAELAELSMAHLQNKAGKFVAPSPESGLASLGGPNEKKIPENLHIEITDPEGDGAYPIVTYTWMLCYRKYASPKVGATMKMLLEYCLTDGQTISEELGYLRLPARVQEKSMALAKKIE
jgi:phosphate transport system substrate-binding protein